MLRSHEAGSLRKTHAGETVTSLAGFHAAEIMAELPSLIFVMHQVLYR